MTSNFKMLHLGNQLCYPLYAASRLTTKIYSDFLEDLDLTYPQYLVMLVLWEKDMQTVNQISHKLYLETNTITPMLKRLEQKDIIKRKRSTVDERAVIVSLTRKGKSLQQKAITIPQSIAKSFFSKEVTQIEISTLKKTMVKIVDVLNNNVNNVKAIKEQSIERY